MTIVLDKFYLMNKIILFFCVLVFSISSNTNNLISKEIGNNIKNSISNEIEEVKPDINQKTNISSSSAEDIFGDEQTFPFVAGLGKNAAH